MWMTGNRHHYGRDKLRYPSDLTDAEWRLINPLIPAGQARRRQAHCEHARGDQRRDICAEYRLYNDFISVTVAAPG